MSTTIFETVIIPEKKGIKIKCKCGNIWIYCGKKLNYCTCSKCRTSITINSKRKKKIFLENISSSSSFSSFENEVEKIKND
jgi:hypothetical protein